MKGFPMTPKFLMPAALSVSAAALLATGAIGGALFTRHSEVAPAPVAVKPTALSVDEVCVAVLSNGGRPQDCARMYLTSEYPGYGRDRSAGTELPGQLAPTEGTEIPPRPR